MCMQLDGCAQMDGCARRWWFPGDARLDVQLDIRMDVRKDRGMCGRTDGCAGALMDVQAH